MSSPELPNCNCVQVVTDRHHVTPPFGPSTPTQQTGRPKIRTSCHIVCCPQSDVRKTRHAISLKCVHPLAKADHFMMCPSYKWLFYFALWFSIKYINNCYRHLFKSFMLVVLLTMFSGPWFI